MVLFVGRKLETVCYQKGILHHPSFLLQTYLCLPSVSSMVEQSLITQWEDEGSLPSLRNFYSLLPGWKGRYNIKKYSLPNERKPSGVPVANSVFDYSQSWVLASTKLYAPRGSVTDLVTRVGTTFIPSKRMVTSGHFVTQLSLLFF